MSKIIIVTLFATLASGLPAFADQEEAATPCATAAVKSALAQARQDAADPEEAPVNASITAIIVENSIYLVSVVGGSTYEVATRADGSACQATGVRVHRAAE